MSRSMFAAAAALLLAGSPASAEIVSRHADGFTLRYAAAMETAPDDIRAAIGDLPKWWDGAHTYSGDAANLSMTMAADGCWCETVADGGTFEHGRVVMIDPAGRVVLNAPLGPLHGTATRAELTYSWTPRARGWLVSMDFVVEGPGLGAAADAVDGVMQAGFERFTRYIEYGTPTP